MVRAASTSGSGGVAAQTPMMANVVVFLLAGGVPNGAGPSQPAVAATSALTATRRGTAAFRAPESTRQKSGLD
jgi:hypothetical protein